MLCCKCLSVTYINIFPVQTSIRLEMISYFEGFLRNWSNRDLVTSRIRALITPLCMFASCRIRPPPFLAEYPNEKLDWFSLQPRHQHERLTVFVLTAREVGPIGWQEGGKLVSVHCPPALHLQAGDLEAIETHICRTDIHQFSTHVIPSGHISIGPTRTEFRTGPRPERAKELLTVLTPICVESSDESRMMAS